VAALVAQTSSFVMAITIDKIGELIHGSVSGQ